ncbi:MAG: E3 ubiquitin-protein ligase bre1 [Peltula sp. TS41687]|nr:MAG: E3 ubiquitin-protein ligase bre1 [Peltula sp. TS41687]
MSSAEAQTLPVGLVKMEDKKRPATHNHEDHAPPRKKQATTVNGAIKPDPDADMPWKDDLERYRKDAIYRQMLEYKREKQTLENRVTEMTKRAAYFDDHLRVIDAWLRQLLDELRTVVGGTENIELPVQNGEGQHFASALMFSNSEEFQGHLQSHAKAIKSTVSQIFNTVPRASSPDVSSLQERVLSLLAAEKEHEAEVDRLRSERDQIEEELSTASLRYMVAERRLDRLKSQPVAKLEQQSILGGSSQTVGTGSHSTNAIKREGSDATEINAEIETARKEAVAVSEKQREQLDKLEAETENLTERVTTLTVKISNLSDDDYARSELFKYMKSQYEDVIKRINHLEATNVQLREEAASLQAERTAYREKLERESQAPIGELEQKLARAEIDLARIRAARDELGADVSIRKATQDREQGAYDHMKELVAAREDRIKALESEIERMRLQVGQSNHEPATAEELNGLNLEELMTKYRTLEKEYSLLNNELPSMGAAWKKASTLAAKKVADSSALEEKLARLQAEKAKADQKYFATMKLNESREAEVKTLRAQNLKSSEIIAQLKEVEATTRQLLQNLERQLQETKDALTALTTQNRNLQHQITQSNITTGGLRTQVTELTATLRQKDTTLGASQKSQRRLETDLEQAQVRLAEMEKSVDRWKSKAAGNESEEFEMLRTLCLCGVCKSRFKDTSLKTCGHLFCKACVEERVQSRERRCPHCGRAFGATDAMAVHM